MKRRTFWLLAILVLFLLMASLETSQAELDKTASVSASATMGEVSTLKAYARNIDGGYDALGINFGTISTLTNRLAPQYVQIEVRSNIIGPEGAWELEIYTKNFPSVPNPDVWGDQYGGLIGAVVGQRVPMVWQAYRDTAVVFNPPDDLANSGWLYVKDKNDQDMGETTDYDESWNNAHDGGYTNVAYGGIDYIMVIQPGTGLQGGVLDDDDKFVVYLGGLFSSAAAGTYSTAICFDLYHE